MKRATEAELVEQAIELLWSKHQYEDAIALAKRLLRRRPRYPLYYLILSDCYMGIHKRHHTEGISVESDKSERYWYKAVDPDSKFTHSDYYQQGIEVAAGYLLATQDLEKLTEVQTKKLQELHTKPLGNLYSAVLGQVSMSKDPDIRLDYLKSALMQSKAGKNQNLYAFDSEGKFVKPTLDEFYKEKRKDPKRQLFFVVSSKDPITGQETHYKFNILKNLRFDIPSESVIKARQRRSNYYYKKIDGIEIHREERKKYQKLYDIKHRQRKRVRNKLDYSWKKSGLTRLYNYLPPAPQKPSTAI